MNPLKRQLAAGKRVRGCFLTLPSADVAEVLAQAGFDFLLIDHEHAGGSIGDAVGQMRAMAATATPAMVRLPSADPIYVKRILDAGAQSVLCPGVETEAEAAALVDMCFYPPRGTRGAGGGVRASRYGHDAGYHGSANDRLLVAAQIESVAGVGNIAAIAAVPGIDMLLIGPRDLSGSMGKLNRFDDPDVLATVAKAERRIVASGRYLASVVYPGLTQADMFARGHRLLIVGSDVSILAQGARALLEPVPVEADREA